MPDYSLSYVYVFAFFVVGAIFVTALLTLSRLVAPRKATKEKLRTYESGEEPIGQAWGRYPTHFYVFALLFVVFDVEVIFLFPWAVLFRSLGVTGYSVNAGVDTGAEMRSVTFVRGTGTKVTVMLRTSCTELDPHVPTLTPVWEGANWCERETYDMFGIEFDGHPDLRRIFLEESFPGHPLRKSFLPPRSDARGG